MERQARAEISAEGGNFEMWSAIRRTVTIEWIAFALALTLGTIVCVVALGSPLLSLATAAAFGIAVGLAIYAGLFSSRYKRL